MPMDNGPISKVSPEQFYWTATSVKFGLLPQQGIWVIYQVWSKLTKRTKNGQIFVIIGYLLLTSDKETLHVSFFT
jgi:hypothetical protein